jgi:hypothetical protein
MKRIIHVVVAFALLVSVMVSPASAAGTRLIVRVNTGLPLLQTLCRLLRCNVNYGLGDPDGQLFLITVPDGLALDTFLGVLRLQLGIVSAEVDFQGNILAGSNAPPAPPAALFDATPVNYYGTTVRRGT